MNILQICPVSCPELQDEIYNNRRIQADYILHPFWQTQERDWYGQIEWIQIAINIEFHITSVDYVHFTLYVSSSVQYPSCSSLLYSHAVQSSVWIRFDKVWMNTIIIRSFEFNIYTIYIYICCSRQRTMSTTSTSTKHNKREKVITPFFAFA